MWPPTSTSIPITRRRHFPGLGREDRRVLQHALDTGHLQPDEMWLNVPMGPPPDWAKDPALAPFAVRLSMIYQRRVDLIYRGGDRLWIVEIKPLAGPTALGQVLLYTHLARVALAGQEDPFPAILCTAAQPDMPGLLRQFGVRLLTCTCHPGSRPDHTPALPADAHHDRPSQE